MFGFGERWGTQRYPKILLVDFMILGSTTSPLSTRRQQLQRSSTSRSKCPDETSASCATVSTSITSILIVGIVGVALLSQSLEGKHVEIWSYFCAWAVGYANSSLYTVFQFILYMFFFFKCWKRARSEHQQSNGLHLSCCPVFAAPCCWFFSSSRTHSADQVAIKGSKSEMKTCKQQAGFTSRM